MPKAHAGRKSLSAMLILLFCIPLLLSLASDWQSNGKLDWFGYVGGGLALCYLFFALPVWFLRPNPVVFLPCDFVGLALYLWYIAWATGGNWFFPFALPVTGCLAVIGCAMVTLLRYVNRGQLYIYGGGCIALGIWILLVEYLLSRTFDLAFIGWSTYPLVVLVLLGGLLIYAAIDRNAREMLERKLFF